MTDRTSKETMRSTGLLVALAAFVTLSCGKDNSSTVPGSKLPFSDLKQPFKVLAAGSPIDVDLGFAAPCWVDYDGDGLKDLLVGQFGRGRLRIYRNIGSPGTPRFSDFFYFQAAGTDGTIPSS